MGNRQIPKTDFYVDTDPLLTKNSNSRVPSQKAVKTYIDALLPLLDALVLKGSIDCSGNPNFPAAECGYVYKVSVSGKLGGASGLNVLVGDLAICLVDGTPSGDYATVGSKWTVIQSNIDFATAVEAIAGTITYKSISPSTLTSRLSSPGPIGDVLPSTISSTLLKALGTGLVKGAAIINSGFAGTVSSSSTTVTFSSSADAILAGYDATNPILGTTIIANAVTRYIVSWTNSTTCLLNSSPTGGWSSTAITSVQFPIATFVNSAGTMVGFMTATGVMYFLGSSTSADVGLVALKGANALFSSQDTDVGNIWKFGSDGGSFLIGEDGVGTLLYIPTNTRNWLLCGLTTAGTSAAKILEMGGSTMPTANYPADAACLGAKDVGAVAGTHAFHMTNELGETGPVGFSVPKERIQITTNALTLDDCNGNMVSNYNQAGAVTRSLPAAVAGLAFMFVATYTYAGLYAFDPNGSEQICLDGVDQVAGKYVGFSSVAKGNQIYFFTAAIGSGTYQWFANTISGSVSVEA